MLGIFLEIRVLRTGSRSRHFSVRRCEATDFICQKRRSSSLLEKANEGSVGRGELWCAPAFRENAKKYQKEACVGITRDVFHLGKCEEKE